MAGEIDTLLAAREAETARGRTRAADLAHEGTSLDSVCSPPPFRAVLTLGPIMISKADE